MYRKSGLNHMGCPVCVYAVCLNILFWLFLLWVPLLFRGMFICIIIKFRCCLIWPQDNVNRCVFSIEFFFLSFVLVVQGKYCTQFAKEWCHFDKLLSLTILWFGTIVRNELKSWFFFFTTVESDESSFRKKKKLNKNTEEEKRKKTSANWFSLYFIFLYIDEVDRYAIVIKSKH